MRILEVHLNGRRVCEAGVGSPGAISVITTWVHREARHPETHDPIPGEFEEKLSLHVGGLMTGEDGADVSTKWYDDPLQVGDEILIRVREAPQSTPPSRAERIDPAEFEKNERRYYEMLRKKYGD